MQQFIHTTREDFETLFRQLNGNCLRFRQQQLPRGCTPSEASLGFERDPFDGRIRVYVDRGVQYFGLSPSLQNWIASGVAEFASIDDLVTWLRDEVRPSLGEDLGASPHAGSGRDRAVPSHGPVTDTRLVTAQLALGRDALYVDEQDLFAALGESVKGQDEALRTLASALSRQVARVQPRRPLTVFATGPTGVGKTWTGLSIVEALNRHCDNGTKYEFLRLDMCEYRESHRVSQLLGSPQGYVGYGDGAQLSDCLSRNAKVVVLFDEIEKAHPDILRVLMNAMDAGRLSTPNRSGRGTHEIDCRKAIFYFSSNLEAEGILRSLQQRQAFDQPAVVDEVCQAHLKTAGLGSDLVGRINHFLAFRGLTPESTAEIAALEIRKAAREYGVDVDQVAPEVVVDVIQATASLSFGARAYDYQIHRLLGRLFAEIARQGVVEAVNILGPAPYSYALRTSAAGVTPPHPSAGGDLIAPGTDAPGKPARSGPGPSTLNPAVN